jgi:hypothetical protein
MAQQALFTPNRALDANAYAQPGATATFYASGTMTLITVYSDEAGTIATTNPITADGNGIFPQSFVTVEAKVIVQDADGATLWTVDPCPATSGDVTGAANVSFTPTVEVPQTNVQAAIEAVAASVITGASDFGLGITGNGPTISNIDATAQASGVYRFTGTSTGTFPIGITASTTGLVRIDRQTAAEAIMFLRAAGGTRYFVRHLVASTWGAWQGQIDDSTLVISSETLWSNDNNTTVPASATVLDAIGARLIVVHEETAGTGGGTATSGSFQTRTLNTVRFNGITGASVASNQITLPAGTYIIDALAPGYRVDGYTSRLQNITDGATTLTGTAEITEQSGAIVTTASRILGSFTIAGTKAFEVQSRVSTSSAGSGYGRASGFQAEVYTTVSIQRVA